MKIKSEIKNNYVFSAAVEVRTPPEIFSVDISYYSDDRCSATQAFKVKSFDDLIYFFENIDSSS